MSINILFILFIVLMILNIKGGYKKGLVKEVVSLISMIVLCIVIVLLASGIVGYMNGKLINVIVAVVLLAIIGIVHYLIGLVLLPAKLVVKLPIIKFADKLLGIVFGAIETVMLLWTLYTLVMMMDLGLVEEIIVAHTQDSRLLTWLYQNNYLAQWLEQIVGDFTGIL